MGRSKRTFFLRIWVCRKEAAIFQWRTWWLGFSFNFRWIILKTAPKRKKKFFARWFSHWWRHSCSLSMKLWEEGSEGDQAQRKNKFFKEDIRVHFHTAVINTHSWHCERTRNWNGKLLPLYTDKNYRKWTIQCWKYFFNNMKKKKPLIFIPLTSINFSKWWKELKKKEKGWSCERDYISWDDYTIKSIINLPEKETKKVFFWAFACLKLNRYPLWVLWYELSWLAVGEFNKKALCKQHAIAI